MERNNQNSEIYGVKDSRFSPEERARMARENEKYRSAAKNAAEVKRAAHSSDSVKTEKKKTEKTVKQASKDKNRKKTDTAAVSRNQRVRNSSENRKKQRKLQNNLIIVMLLVVALAVIGAFACFAMTINTIQVSGSERYSEKTVLEAAKLEKGDSILLMNPASIKHKIESKLPYIENAEIKRDWPDGVIVNLTDAEPTLALDTGNGYILMNDSCKVLDDSAAVVSSSAIIKGVTVENAVPGEIAEFSGDISTEAFVRLCQAFGEYGIENISEYDLTIVSSIKVMIGHRIEVQLGTLAGAADKLAFCKAVIDKTIASDSKHPMVINITADGKAYARRKDDNNVSFEESSAEKTTTSAADTASPEETTETPDNVVAVG